jgi:hypothetical protein
MPALDAGDAYGGQPELGDRQTLLFALDNPEGRIAVEHLTETVPNEVHARGTPFRLRVLERVSRGVHLGRKELEANRVHESAASGRIGEEHGPM